jgi:glyoxylase I family protein
VGNVPSIRGAHHVALTVRDVDRSEQWYSDLLGLQTVLSTDTDDARIRVMVHPDSGWLLGLRQHIGHGDDGEFSEFRTGLDHFAFTVGSREELAAWEAELGARGVPFSPVAESPVGTFIALRDPDNIQLELWLPLGS